MGWSPDAIGCKQNTNADKLHKGRDSSRVQGSSEHGRRTVDEEDADEQIVWTVDEKICRWSNGAIRSP